MIEWQINIKTVSEANTREHWTKSAARHKTQQKLMYLAYKRYVTEPVKLPCVVTLTRIASRLLDDDNLVTSMKYIRDELSECIFPEKRKSYVAKNGKIVAIKGRADSDPRVTWRYAQEKFVIPGVRVQIEY